MKKRALSKIPASAKRTYKLLSESLLKQLEEKSFEKISTIDICKGANVPRATFYNHFDDKYDLLRYTLRNVTKDIIPSVSESTSTNNYIIKMIENFIQFTIENEKIIKKINSANYNSILFAEIKNIMYENLYEIMTYKESKKKGYSANMKIVAQFYASGIVYSAKTWLDEGMTIPKNEIIDSAKAILFSYK